MTLRQLMLTTALAGLASAASAEIKVGFIGSLSSDTGLSTLRGAEMVLLDHTAFARSQEIARKITYIELNVNQEFMIRFSGSRFIPHTDPGLFPSVPSVR